MNELLIKIDERQLCSYLLDLAKEYQCNCSIARVEKSSAFTFADAVDPFRHIEYDCVRRFSYDLGARRHVSTIKYDI